MKEPYTIDALWGIWLPNGGPDKAGRWLHHANGIENGPEAFESLDEAKSQVECYANDFPRCYAAPLTSAAKAMQPAGIRTPTADEQAAAEAVTDPRPGA